MKKWLVLGLGGILLLAGCTTNPSFKGSPFYSTFYERHEVPDPDRVNTIATYYSHGELYIPWGLPLMEFGPRYQAVRPLYAAYGMDQGRPVYTVLWPVGRFDHEQRKYRIFPVCWGDDYFNVVPLYWHEGEPLSGTGHDALIPLWMWNKREDGHYLGILWPLYANYEHPNREGWWLWPAYGSRQKDDAIRRFYAWPFIHTFSSGDASGHTVLPLWHYADQPDRSLFMSLPYTRSMTAVPGAKSWDLALPVWYRAWSGDRLSWMAIPALSWGQYDPNAADNWFALGLGRYGQSEDSLNHHVIPLYLYNRDPEARSIYTLPWWSKKYADGTGWNMLFPAYYYGHGADEKSFYSLPFLAKQREDGSGWFATVPLYYRGYATNASSFYSPIWFYKRDPDGSSWHTTVPLYLRTVSNDRAAWYTLPWSRVQNADGSGWSTTIPFYYHAYSTNSSAFYSPVWFAEKHPDGAEWQAMFPLYFGSSSEAGSLLMTPVYARKRNADGSPAWRCYIPFIYINNSYDSHFMTLLGGRWRMGESYNWLALPLLSGGAHDADSGRNVWLAGLAGNHWNEAGKSSYVIPFYYDAPTAFFSLPYSDWQKGGRKTSVSPVLLSGWYRENDLSGGLFAAGMAGYRKGGDRPFHYVFPLYYHAPDKTLSLLYAAWRNGDKKTTVLPWTLSGWWRENDTSGALIAAGLAGYRGGDEKAYAYLLPFFYYAPQKGSFFSLLYTQWAGVDRRNHAIPWLLSGWSSDAEGSDILLAGGLAAWRKEQQGVTASHLIPLWMWSKDDYFYTVPFGHDRKKNYYVTPLVGSYRTGSGKTGRWAIPLYWHRRNVESGAVSGCYFPLGYYGKTEHRSNHGFLGLYDYSSWQIDARPASTNDVSQRTATEGHSLQYLLFFGESSERKTYALDGNGEKEQQVSYRKDQSFFPLWSHRINEDLIQEKKTERSSLGLVLYKTSHEQDKAVNLDHSRHQVLWRLYRSESINGDTFTDMPGVTINSYENGRSKVAVLWRLFRYEKDPEKGEKKLDLLFIPLKR